MSVASDVVRAALATSPEGVRGAWSDHINPTFVEALDLCGFRRDFVRAEGTRLWDAQGRSYLDFLAGYGAVSLGHNHPEVRAALGEVLRADAPHFLLVGTEALAAALARKLAQVTPGDLAVSFLCSSGSEAVEGALKLARAVTHRARFVSFGRAYHGTTLGALSVTDCARHRGPFEPLLDGVAIVPFGDAAAVERELRKRDVAAVIVEPIQGEGGIRVPPAGFLSELARLCKRYGTLLIADEVATGLGRTGTMFACEAEDVVPDVLVLAKGLSGGMVPVGAYVTRRDLWKRAYGTLERYDIHCSTFRGGPLASAAALTTLEVIEREKLVTRAATLGARLGERLREITHGHPLVREVRGRGLMWGIELRAPEGGTTAALIGQWLVVGLLERGMLVQVGTLASHVVRVQPALIAGEEEIDRFGEALRATLAEHATGHARALAGAAGRMLSRTVSNAATKLLDKAP